MSVSTADVAARANSPAMRDRLLARIEECVLRILSEEQARWEAVDPRGRVPVDAIAELIEAGGKRLRPAFCVTGFLAAGGDPDDPTIVDAAAGLEFLHAFALIHDDVMDHSSLRRGMPTVHVRHTGEHTARGWRGESRRYGESVAILAGDLAYSYADRLLAAVPPAAREVWSSLTSETIIGQFLDIAVAAESVVDPELSRWIAVGKSGRYSIHRPLVLGAAIAGRTDLGSAFQEYGTTLGEAFQLRDDLIDAYGDTDAAGKPTGHDLKQHKMTLLLALAAGRDERVRDMITTGEWDSRALHSLLDECGVRDEVEQRIDELVEAARAAITHTEIDPQWQDELRAMALQVAYRDR
ncbi:MAG TPA: polyprenyl synthetase family protein [Micromonospora sp.]|nr:polyprenyl synthetase family protein [Micromonospora sp.]